MLWHGVGGRRLRHDGLGQRRTLPAICNSSAQGALVAIPPIIDIAPIVDRTQDRVAARRAMHRACLDTGCFVAVGHGLERSMPQVFSAARQFFAQPQAAKERTPRVDRYGYVPRDIDALDTSRQTGTSEWIDIGFDDEFELPNLPGFRAAVATYQLDALEVGRSLMRELALGLGAPADAFTRHMAHPQCRLRFLHYFPMPRAADGSLQVPTTPHTDYGGITLLATDGVPGLEVRPLDGDWTPVEAPPGSLVVNLGDMLARWTNDVYRSTPHRVVASTDRHRYSIPFFVNPDPETVVECLPVCVTATRPRRYEPITAGEFLVQRIDSSAEPSVGPGEGVACGGVVGW